MLKDPVVFECVTGCCMTGKMGTDTALMHEMSAVMKVRWWELRRMDVKDMKQEARCVNRKRFCHLKLLERDHVESA